MDLKIDPKHYTLIGLIIIFLVFGMIIGYVVNKQISVDEVIATPTATPEKEDAIVTPTATPDAVETVVAPTPTTAVTQTVNDFIIKKLYDPETDKPTETIEILNWDSYPKSVRIHPKESVLIKITETKQSSLNIIFNETNLGKKGAVLITFNNKGTYYFKVIIPSGDPNINSRTFAEGSVIVN